MKISKKLIYVMATLTTTFVVSSTAFAWHFHGGNVRDFINEIKEKVETAKQSDIAKKVNDLKDLQKAYNANLKDLQKVVTDSRSLFDKPNYTKGMLNSDNAKKELKDLYTIKLDGSSNNFFDSMHNEMDRVQNQALVERQQTVTVANDIERLNQEIAMQTKKINDMETNSSLYSEEQKKSALLVLQTKQEQLNGLLETQASMVDTSDVAITNMEHHIGEATSGMSPKPAFVGNGSDFRIKEFPR